MNDRDVRHIVTAAEAAVLRAEPFPEPRVVAIFTALLDTIDDLRTRLTQAEDALREIAERKTSTGIPWYPAGARERARAYFEDGE